MSNTENAGFREYYELLYRYQGRLDLLRLTLLYAALMLELLCGAEIGTLFIDSEYYNRDYVGLK